MQPNQPAHSAPSPPFSQPDTPKAPFKQPRLLLQQSDTADTRAIFAFPPNRETLGATAYFIVGTVNVLVDCPAWDDANQAFLQAQGGVHVLLLTHRGGIGNVRALQAAFGCEVIIQEQEAYLLPGLAATAFGQTYDLSPQLQAIWTPGHSPGSACLYDRSFGGVLFSGRHLLPTPSGGLQPLKVSKTFHWPRQLQSVQRLRDRFTPETLQFICPGANTGFLRGRYLMEPAYALLTQIDLEALKTS